MTEIGRVICITALVLTQLPGFSQVTLPENVKEEIANVKELEKRGLFEQSLEKAESLIKKYDAQPEYVGYFLLRMGSALCLAKKCKLGLQYFRKSNQYGTRFSDTVLLGNSYLGLGSGFQFLHINDSAYYYYERARPFLTHKEDTINLIGIESNISLMSDNFQDKENKYLILARIREDLGDYLGVTACYYNLGMLYVENLNYKEANKSFYKSYELAKNHNYRNDLIKAQRGLAISSFYMGDKEKAFKYFLEYDSAAAKWLYSEEYNDKILELETKYKTSEIERDNAIKQAEIDEKKIKLTFLYVVIALLILILVSGYLFLDQRRKRIKMAALRLNESAQQKIQSLVQQQETNTTYALLEGQDQERQRIATELHDNLGNILATLSMYADALMDRSKTDEIKDLSTRISTASKNANNEVRRISHNLESGLLKHFGLRLAIEELMEAIRTSNNIEVKLDLELKQSLEKEKGLQVYRIIQELVTNSLKHSNCTLIHLDVTQVNGELNLIYEDNGSGFDPQSVKEGMGLRGIQQRVDNLHGELKVDSEIGRGSTFIVEVPSV